MSSHLGVPFLQVILNKSGKKHPVLFAFISVTSSILDTFAIGLVLPLLTVIIDKNFINNNWLFQEMFTILNITGYKNRVIAFCTILIIFFILKILFQLFVLVYQSNYYTSAIQNLSVDLLEKKFGRTGAI